jgi:hypothetical protein
MNAAKRKEKGKMRKMINLAGSLSQNEMYIRRYMHLLDILEPCRFVINTTATYSSYIEDMTTNMSVAVFTGKNPFRYEPF